MRLLLKVLCSTALILPVTSAFSQDSVANASQLHKKGEITSRSTPDDYEISPGDGNHHQEAVEAISKFLYLYRLPGSNEELENARIKAWHDAMDYIEMPASGCSKSSYPYLVNEDDPCDSKANPPPNPPQRVFKPSNTSASD